MAGASVSYHLDDDAVRAAIAGLLAASDDLSGPMVEIGEALVSSTNRRFEEGQAPDGSPWPPSIRAQLTGGTTLVESGRLRDSITYEADASSVRVGTNVLYAAIHQFGGTIRARGGGRLTFRLPADLGFVSPESVQIPARPFLGISEEDEAEILGVLEDWLRDASDGALEGSAP
jgi:phage virion morphogenesis protein